MIRLVKNNEKGDQEFILEELRKGNERALAFIFKEYYKPLSHYSYSFTKDQDKSESLVQEAFVRLWEKRESLYNIESLLAYMTAMVRNISIDYLRKEKTSHKVHREMALPESANTTEEHISKNEFEQKLTESVMKLPERCRIAFELSRFESQTNKEIAEAMQISVKGVEALIGRSLKLLRIELKEFMPSFNPKSDKRNFILFSIFKLRF